MPKIYTFFIKKFFSLDLGIILLLIAVVINIYEFPLLDKSRSDPAWKAIYRYDNSDLIEISYYDNLRLQQRYNPAIALGLISPGATVFLPETYKRNNEEFLAQLLSFGKVEKIIFKPYDSRTIIADFNPSPFLIETGEENYRYTPWGIAIGKSLQGEFIIVKWDSVENGEMDLLIDTSLLSDEILSELK